MPANPISKVTWKAPEVAEEVDRRVVASPAQVRQLLATVARMRPDVIAFFGCLYYATMRPGEAVSLRQADCLSLPEAGRGLLLLTGNAPRVGSKWTDSGHAHDARHSRQATVPPVPHDVEVLVV